MDQVDEIIIMSLKRLGVSFVDESVNKLHMFDADLIVEAVVLCLVAIDSGLADKFPTRLPDSMSLKFRLCAEIAGKISELGFKSEIGYQTLLYPNEMELRYVFIVFVRTGSIAMLWSLWCFRRLFMFLVENLPREVSSSSLSTSETVDPITRARLQLAALLQKQLQEPWRPHYLTPKHLTSRNWFKTYTDFCTKVESVEPNTLFVPSLLEYHADLNEKQNEKPVEKADAAKMKAKIEELEKELVSLGCFTESFCEKRSLVFRTRKRESNRNCWIQWSKYAPPSTKK